MNKLAILEIRDEHWFYVNDALACHFQDFRVYMPSVTKLYPTLENLIETAAK